MQLSLSTLAFLIQASLSLGAAISKATQNDAVPVSTPDSALPTPTNDASNSVEGIIQPQQTFVALMNAIGDGDVLPITVSPLAVANPPGNVQSILWPWWTTTVPTPYNSDGCGQFKNRKECEEFKRKHSLGSR